MPVELVPVELLPVPVELPPVELLPVPDDEEDADGQPSL